MTSNIPQRLIALLLAALAVSLLALAGCNRGDEAPPDTHAAAVETAAGPDGSPAPEGADGSGALVDLPPDDEAAAQADEAGAAEAGDDEAAEDGAAGEEAEDGAEDAEGDESAGEGDDSAGEGEEGAGDEEGGDEPPAEDGGADEQPPAEDQETPAPPTDGEPYVNPDIDAAALYRTTQCGFCHGDDLKGGRQGPPLTNLDRYWDTASLAGFLRDPAAYAEDDQRLVELGRQYNFAMLGTRLSEENRIALAHWLLQQ